MVVGDSLAGLSRGGRGGDRLAGMPKLLAMPVNESVFEHR
jgi:hypothetical protein